MGANLRKPAASGQNAGRGGGPEGRTDGRREVPNESAVGITL